MLLRLTERAWRSVCRSSSLENMCRINGLNSSAFLRIKQLQTWTLRHRASSSSLVCQSTADSKLTLWLMLENGLLVKRKQAELALTLAPESCLQLRSPVSVASQWPPGAISTPGRRRHRPRARDPKIAKQATPHLWTTACYHPVTARRAACCAEADRPLQFAGQGQCDRP